MLQICWCKESYAWKTYKDYSKQLEAPYKIYADFEAVIKKAENSEKGVKLVHVISGYYLFVKSPYEEDMRVSYWGDDAGYWFIGYIQFLSKQLKRKIRHANAEMIYGVKEKKEFENAKQCHICECDIEKNKNDHLGNIYKGLQYMRLHNRYPF